MTELPFHDNPLEVFRRLADLGRPVLLESPGQNPTGRWDLLGVVDEPQDSVILPGTLPARASIAALRRLQERMERSVAAARVSPAGADAGDLPFCGGYVGHLSYELGRRLQGLPARRTALPLAVVHACPWAVVQDRRERRAWLVGTFPPLLGEKLRRRLDGKRASPVAPFALTEPFRPAWSEEQFAAAFARVQAYITAGDCYQINLGQPFRAAYRGDLLDAYAALRDVAAAPFSSLFPLDAHSTLLSLSPERFLAVADGRVEARPIKGTRPRGRTPAEDRAAAAELLASAKERAENTMIVDLLRNDIGRHCETGSVRADDLYRVETYATVHHLTSVVSGRLREDRSPLDLLFGCLPGGSVTGAPKRRAMEIIDELEVDSRQAWCGSVFYQSRCGRLDSSIAIRTLMGHGTHLTCWAGGGLVADSEAAAEYREQQHKVGALLACLEDLGRADLSTRAAPDR